MKQLIINADDFGLTHSVNKAIVDVYKAGNLTSTTLMVNMPGTEEAVQLSSENPGLAIGLHFCITEGKPLSDCSSLLGEDGNFINRSQLIKKSYRGKINSDDLIREFRAQLKKVIDLGVNITHVDSHQHILQIPFVFKSVNKVLEEHSLKVRRVMPPRVSWSLSPSTWKRTIKNSLNAKSANRMKEESHCVMNDVLVSVHDKHSDMGFSRKTYDVLIEECSVNQSIELMVHPYILGSDVINLYQSEIDTKMTFLKKCEKEYQLLNGEPLFGDCSLINFGDL